MLGLNLGILNHLRKTELNLHDKLQAGDKRPSHGIHHNIGRYAREIQIPFPQGRSYVGDTKSPNASTPCPLSLCCYPEKIKRSVSNRRGQVKFNSYTTKDWASYHASHDRIIIIHRSSSLPPGYQSLFHSLMPSNANNVSEPQLCQIPNASLPLSLPLSPSLPRSLPAAASAGCQTC